MPFHLPDLPMNPFKEPVTKLAVNRIRRTDNFDGHIRVLDLAFHFHIPFVFDA